MSAQPDGGDARVFLACEDVPRPAGAPVRAAGYVTRAFCACKLDHPCYRNDIRECYGFADGPDGLCGRCRPGGPAAAGHPDGAEAS